MQTMDKRHAHGEIGYRYAENTRELAQHRWRSPRSKEQRPLNNGRGRMLVLGIIKSL